jgi:hypothetical protein
LSAAADVALVFGFADRLKAHAVEVGERELREFGGEPVDWVSSVYFSQAWYVFLLAAIAILSVAAVALLRALRRGNQAGRIGLIVISAIAIFWAVLPCFEPGFEAPADLTPWLLGVMAVKRLGYLGLGIATLVLLVMPAAQAFTKPRLT